MAEKATWQIPISDDFAIPRSPHILHFLLVKVKSTPEGTDGFNEFARILDEKQRAKLWPGRLLHAGPLSQSSLGYTHAMIMIFQDGERLKKYMVDHTPDGMRTLVPQMAEFPTKGGSFVADLVLPAAGERSKL